MKYDVSNGELRLVDSEPPPRMASDLAQRCLLNEFYRSCPQLKCRLESLVGKRFGDLTVAKVVIRNSRVRLLCRCDCGKIRVAKVRLITNGTVKYCDGRKCRHKIA